MWKTVCFKCNACKIFTFSKTNSAWRWNANALNCHSKYLKNKKQNNILQACGHHIWSTFNSPSFSWVVTWAHTQPLTRASVYLMQIFGRCASLCWLCSDEVLARLWQPCPFISFDFSQLHGPLLTCHYSSCPKTFKGFFFFPFIFFFFVCNRDKSFIFCSLLKRCFCTKPSESKYEINKKKRGQAQSTYGEAPYIII